jgi:hypothetical protein
VNLGSVSVLDRISASFFGFLDFYLGSMYFFSDFFSVPRFKAGALSSNHRFCGFRRNVLQFVYFMLERRNVILQNL